MVERIDDPNVKINLNLDEDENFVVSVKGLMRFSKTKGEKFLNLLETEYNKIFYRYVSNALLIG